MPRKDRHVVPNSDKGWSVRRSGAARASRVFDTQAQAIDYARSQAKKDKAELYIHKKDGTIRDRDSYGNDPKKTKG